MNPRSSFLWKIVYLAGIALLLPLLFWLSQPGTSGRHGAPGTPGGKLAQLRQQYRLSQTQLGQIDPASETIKLATLGLRGVAALILWEKAIDYKMKKDWTNFAATLNQLIKLEPNFVNVWVHQGWNLSYNVSVEFDDYRQRYHWVIRGIEFLKEGTKYNDRDSYLVWSIGWTIAQKIGKSDERKQFRRLFKADDDFHGSRPLDERDNWLVGKEWFQKAEDMVERGARLRGTSPVIFYSETSMCRTNYAIAVEGDGTFGEVARHAWQAARDEWNRFGSKDIPTSDGVIIHLNDQETHEAAARQLVAELEAMEPGLREKLRQEKRAALTPEQRLALDTPTDKRTNKQQTLAAAAGPLLEVTHAEVARRIKGPNHRAALVKAEDAAMHEGKAAYIRSYRQIVNFDYWRLRAQVEQTKETIAARKSIYDGDQAYADADLPKAKLLYEQGLAAWRKVLDKFPPLRDDDLTNEDLLDVVKRYKRILDKLDEPFPEKFILQDVIERQKGKK